MAADKLDDEMRKQLSCSVCLDLYTDPVLLSCLHSLCRECLTNINRSKLKKCPECNTVINVDITKLKRNFPLNNLIDIYKQSEATRAVQSMPRYPVIIHSTGDGNIEIQQPRGQQGEGQTPGQGRMHEQQGQGRSQIQQGQRRSQNHQGQGQIQTHLKLNGEQPPPLPPRTKMRRQCSTCDMHSASPADVHCKTCNISFCAKCLDSLHPKDTDHKFLPVADIGKMQTCTLCQSPATKRCVQCQITFCPQCLENFHPSPTSSPAHTLIDANTTGAGHQLDSNAEPTQPNVQDESSPNRPASTPSKSFSSLEIARDVSATVQDRNCALCRTDQSKLGSHRCLDCSVTICRSCLFTHRYDAPSHTVINIGLTQQQQQQQKQQQQQRAPDTSVASVTSLVTPIPVASVASAPPTHATPSSSTPQKPNNMPPMNDLQMKLIELMSQKEGVLLELINVLQTRETSEV